nr:hypothetical protein CPGR_02353 [Mycolicibacterium fortuitum subsp. fortuitum DSM 46621 = ATCC 6841 = JCM 6387]
MSVLPLTSSKTSASVDGPRGSCSTTQVLCTASGSTACRPVSSVAGSSEPVLTRWPASTRTWPAPNGLRPSTTVSVVPSTESRRVPPASPGTGLTRSVSTIANGSPSRRAMSERTSTRIRSASSGMSGILLTHHFDRYSKPSGMPGPSSSAAMSTSTKLTVLNGLINDAENGTWTVCESSGLSSAATCNGTVPFSPPWPSCSVRSVTSSFPVCPSCTFRQLPGEFAAEVTFGVPMPSGPASTVTASESAIHTQPGPVMFSDAVAPCAAWTLPKSIRSPGDGRPSFGRICRLTSTFCGDNWVPGATCTPARSTAGAVVTTNDIFNVAGPGSTWLRSTFTGLPMSSLGTSRSSSMGAAPAGTSCADSVAEPTRSVGVTGLFCPSTRPKVSPSRVWPLCQVTSGPCLPPLPTRAGKMSVEMWMLTFDTASGCLPAVST